MTFDDINKFILELSNVIVTQPFGQDKLVYSLKTEMFAILDKNKIPARISLRCDPQLAKFLRDKYDEVMPGDHLDSQKWNTIILSGQLGPDEIKDLIRLSYNLAAL